MSGLPYNPNLNEAGKGTQFQPGQSGNPNGRPKGSKNWSTIVQELLMDEAITDKVLDAMNTKMPFWKDLPNKNGASIITATMLYKAMAGDIKAAEWLRKTGFGDKLDITSDGEQLATTGVASEEKAAEFQAFLLAQASSKGATPPTPAPAAPTVSQPIAAAANPQPLNARPLNTQVVQPPSQPAPAAQAAPVQVQQPTAAPTMPSAAQPLAPQQGQPNAA